jgi:demethylmenaquinone methyltransferase / 2-methoxy-6-polyprenyl-1,4-benzoquinol methylase
MNDKSRSVQKMFARIAGRYDLLNRLMTFGQDIAWRRVTVKTLGLVPCVKVLDVGCGTGDLAYETLRQRSDATITACDFTWEMVTLAKDRVNSGRINWLIADAMYLPFKTDTFECVTSGFLMRNVTDKEKTFSEQFRILKTGGKFAALDTTPAQDNFFKPFIQVYLKYIVPLLGRFVAGDRAAYTYLPETTMQFLTADQLARVAEKAGFEKVVYRRMNFGTVAIHSGQKK